MGATDMLKETLPEIRAEAKRLGIPWEWVCKLKDQMIADEREKREIPELMRRAAWHSYVGGSSGSAPFWRHGFRARFKTLLAKGSDFTKIPCYDLVAAAVMEQLPGMFKGAHAGDCGPVEEIWDFLLSDYQPWPPRENFYWRALNEIEERMTRAAVCDNEEELCQVIPF
jgi:hypothetical protein